MNWIKEMLSEDSKISSKRFLVLALGLNIFVWFGYYIYKIQNGGTESITTSGLLETALYSAVGLAVGGTGAEAWKSYKKKDTNDN